VVVTALPLYHIFALMVNFVSSFSRGAENWLVPNPRDLDGFVEILEQARPTFFTGVNTLFGGLVSHPRIGEVDFSRLRYAIGGGAPVMPVTSARWKAVTGRDILEGYGSRRPRRSSRSIPPGRPPSPRRWACRSRPPTSSCSTTTAARSPRARRARSARVAPR
jgi:long-chain acyl-CoA synthetase